MFNLVHPLENLILKVVSHGLEVNILLKGLSKVNWVLSGTGLTPPVFLKTFLTMFDSRLRGETSFELNFQLWDFLVLSLISGNTE